MRFMATKSCTWTLIHKTQGYPGIMIYHTIWFALKIFYSLMVSMWNPTYLLKFSLCYPILSGGNELLEEESRFGFKTLVKIGHLTVSESSNSFPGQQMFLIEKAHTKNMDICIIMKSADSENCIFHYTLHEIHWKTIPGIWMNTMPCIFCRQHESPTSQHLKILKCS